MTRYHIHTVPTSLGLPIRINNGALGTAHVFIVPPPSFRINWLTYNRIMRETANHPKDHPTHYAYAPTDPRIFKLSNLYLAGNESPKRIRDRMAVGAV